MKTSIMTGALAAALISSCPAWAEGDPVHGEEVYRQCVICHPIGAGKKAVIGPVQNGVYGAVAGSRPGFAYSAAMRLAGEKGLVWDESNLDKYLENPKAVVPGTKMGFAGLKNEKDRADVIAYLKANPAQ